MSFVRVLCCIASTCVVRSMFVFCFALCLMMFCFVFDLMIGFGWSGLPRVGCFCLVLFHFVLGWLGVCHLGRFASVGLCC